MLMLLGSATLAFELPTIVSRRARKAGEPNGTKALPSVFQARRARPKTEDFPALRLTNRIGATISLLVTPPATRPESLSLVPIGLVLAAAMAWSSEARAQQGQAQGQAPSLPGAEDVEEREGAVKPFAPDQRTGHLYIDAFSAAAFPFGNLSPRGRLSDVAPFGVTVGGVIGVGISRSVEIDVRGSYGQFASDNTCPSCAATLANANLGFTYHALQGAAMDPWVRIGAGYRTLALEYADDEADRILQIATGRYHGIDITNLSLGADFAPVGGFAFGPFIEVDMGTFASWPEGSISGTRAYGFLMLGLEIELDPMQVGARPRRAPAKPPAPPAKPAAKSVAEAAEPCTVDGGAAPTERL